MPNIKSAKKRVVVAEINRQRNAAAKSAVRTQLKKFDAAVVSGDKANAEQLLIESVSIVDKYAGKGVFHKNAAARKKSAIYRAYNNM